MIQIITTGGTIDKIYFDANSQYEVGSPQVAQLLTEANVTFDFEIEQALQKDSLEMTDQDRQLIRNKIESSPAEKILVTHGTDTMVKTAQSLNAIEGKTIVFTGAMQPAAMRMSDAPFNIGFSLGVLQHLAPGVYIAINGRVLDPQDTVKNLDKQCFESV